jgi:hypothetical protein
MRITVPTPLGNAYQGTSADVQLVFDATQDTDASTVG